MSKPFARMPLGVELSAGATRLAVASDASPLPAQRAVARFAVPLTPEAAVEQIVLLLRRALAAAPDAPEGTLGMVGVALAGSVDAEAGVVRALPPAPGWADFPLATRLGAELHVPVRVDSDVNAAALAEAKLGAGAAYAHVLYVHLGRTVTSGYVAHDHLLYGAHGAQGALGHLAVRAGGPRCACGATGHLDPLASSQAVVRAMIGRAADRDDSLAAMLRVTSGRAEAITAGQVVTLAVEGDPAAVAVVGEALDALALALAAAVALLAPEVIVLAGPLAEAGPAFLDPLATRLREACDFGSPAPSPALVRGALGPRAPLAGALLLAEVAAGDTPAGTAGA
ncbi:MAG: ROK family protein [Ktedonobacterales bacterium]